MRYLASRVAPVRGGTYFSLPPQRKVGKRKRLTPSALDVCPRAPSVPNLHTAAHLFTCVANALSVRLTHFIARVTVRRARQFAAAQVANCVSAFASCAHHSGPVAGLVFPVRATSCAVRYPLRPGSASRCRWPSLQWIAWLCLILNLVVADPSVVERVMIRLNPESAGRRHGLPVRISRPAIA